MTSRERLGVGLGLLFIVTLAFAHEGHQAITTKGVMMGPQSSHLLMEPAARKAVGLSTAKVDFADIEETLGVSARVTLPWSRHAYASSRLPGVIERIRAKPGDVVSAGAILAEMSSLELEALQLELTQKLIEKRIAEQSLKRVRDLGERLVAGKELLELEADVADRENSIGVLKEKLLAVGLSQAQLGALAERGETTKILPIVAPIGGHVVHLDLALGAVVEPQQHLAEIQDLSTVWVEAEVPESRAASVREGLELRLTVPAYPSRVFKGKVERLAAEVRKDSRTRIVWTSIENSDSALKPGQFGQATLVLGLAENVFAAPVEAIVEDGAEKYAFVLEKEGAHVRVDPKEKSEEYASEPRAGFSPANAYSKRSVVTGRDDGRRVEILEGLYAGDTVVTLGSHELSALYPRGTLTLSDEAKKNIRLATEEIDLRPIEEVVRLNATLRLPVDRGGVVSSKIEGKILALHALPGQVVKRGDLLAELHSLDLDNLQLEYRAAWLRERLAGTLLERLRPLAASGVAPQKELLALEGEHRVRLSAALSLRRRLEALGISSDALDILASRGDRLHALPLVSPIDGRVADLEVAVGQVIKPDAQVFRVSDARTLWAEAHLFEADFQKVLSGGPMKDALVRVVALPGREWTSKVGFTGPSLASHENILPVFVEIANEDDALLPGMIGEIYVVVGRPDARVITAPVRALLPVGGRAYAFVQIGPSFQRVEVDVGRRDARFAEITRGLFPGDKVAVSGTNALNTAINTLK